MKITEVNTPKAPKAVGPYVQANKVGNLIFCSGQLGINPETGKIVEGGVAALPLGGNIEIEVIAVEK